MDNKILDQFSNIVSRKRKIRINQKFVFFCFFLLFSAIIWYLNKLNGDYVIDIKVPLNVTYSETDKMLVEEDSHTLKLQIKAKGYAILKYKLRAKLSPLSIDISSYKLRHYRHLPNQYYILTANLRNNLSTQLPSSVRIENINPDTLFFKFSTLYSKKVPVVASSKISFDDQYMQVGEIVLSPDSITISGPKSVVENKTFVVSAPIVADKLNGQKNGYVSLAEDKNIKMSATEVAYTIDVAKFTEGKLRLPVHFNGQDSLEILLIPSNVEVTYRVAVSDYGKVQPSMFRLGVDAESPNALTNNVKVKVLAAPSFINNIRIEPDFVELYNQKR